MKQHALLSPSKSSMWLNCTPSARLGIGYATGGDAADEGTLAHRLSEWLLKRALQRTTDDKYIAAIKRVKANKHYNNAMMEHCTLFASYVMEQYNAMVEKHGEAMIFLESHLDLSVFIPEGFGTGDVIIIGGNGLLVIDLKYGKGHFVSVEENTQMMIYALGAIDNYSMLADIRKVKMTIYQPRLDNIDSWQISTKNLLIWAKTTLVGKAKLAFEGEGKLKAGSHCQFCPVKVECKAHADYMLTVAGKEFDELDDPTKLKPADMVGLYLRAKQIRSWLASLEEYMLAKAIDGKAWKGLKLVHGRSVRVIVDKAAVLKALQRKKLPADQYMSEPELLGITALENNIGAKLFDQLAGKYVTKPKGKPSLVHADNKGQDYDKYSSAKEDFS